MKNYLTLHGTVLVLFLLLGAVNGTAWAQHEGPCDERSTYLYWAGGASNDFFDELNWREGKRKVHPPKPEKDDKKNKDDKKEKDDKKDKHGDSSCRPGLQPKFIICLGEHDPVTDKSPKAGTLDPGVPIPFNLYVESANLSVNGDLVFSCVDKGLTLRASQLVANGQLSGTVHLEETSTLRIAGASVPNDLRISLQDHASWVYFMQVNPVLLNGLPLTTWMVDLQVPVSLSALLINQYYQTGAVVRKDPASFSPLTLFSNQGFGGGSATVGTHTIFSGSTIPGGLDNNIRSFKLKRGFMATFAINNNGTGKSKVYIASEEDLEINDLPASLSGNVSFLRVMPWNWSTKKGTGGLFAENPLDAGWFYTWSANNNSQLNNEYVPMTWGSGSTSPSAMQDIIAKNKVTHLLGFNESDNCSGESGQFNNLCRPDVAVAYYERIMGSGLRLGTPAPREGGHSTWLRQFAALAKQRDVRFDFVAVHWYDWGSNPANSPNADPQQIFNRFKTFLAQVYNEYQLPIWITEFNANPNRQNSIHAAFLNLALPYLESLPYVERYAYFQPMATFSQNGDPNADYFDDAGNLSNIGQIYLGHNSSPSMPADTYECPNNLEGMDQPLVVKQPQQFVFEAECGKNPGSKWLLRDLESASNAKFIRGDNTLAGATEQAKQIHYDFEVMEENNFRIWVRTKATNGRAILHVDHERKDTISGISSTDFTWHPIPRLYTFKPGNHRVTLAHWDPNNVITQFDQIAIIAGSDDVNAPILPAESCVPESFVWGLEQPTALFAEGEAASKGASWTTGNNDEAIGGQFAESGAATSPDAVPAETGWLTFSVDVTTAGAYQLWAKVQALEPTSNKLWLKMNDGAFGPWAGLQQPGYLWKWVRFDPATHDGTRQEYLFLEPGTHTFTVAVASGGVKIDRVGLVPAGTTPEAIDPNVIIQTGPQSFEAEEAIILGTAAIVNCATSSNGMQVNMGTGSANGLRFGNVLASSSGTYQLAIQYMLGGTNPRNLRVIVNGTQLPLQRVVPSGLWCFQAGNAPGTWMVSVKLNAGENTIELRPVSGTEAPFIDKIELRSVLVTLEAELAQLTGSVTLPACASSSNNGLASMSNVGSNSIQFNNITVPAAGTYNLNISYFAKDTRSIRMFVDGGAATIINFPISGNWCFDAPAGVPVIKTVPIVLTGGTHTIRFQPVLSANPPSIPTTNSPLLDKIDLVDPSTPVIITGSAPAEEGVAMLRSRVEPVVSGFVYPNPARAGSTIYLPAGNSTATQAATITLLDVRGAAIKTNVQSTKAGFTLPNLPKGIYMVRVNESGTVKTYRLLVQ